MLKDIIQRLREENRWGVIEDAFISMQTEIIEQMKSGRIKDMPDLIKANAQLDILDRCINLENFKGR